MVRVTFESRDVVGILRQMTAWIKVWDTGDPGEVIEDPNDNEPDPDLGEDFGFTQQEAADFHALLDVMHLIGWSDEKIGLQAALEYLPGKKGIHVNVLAPAKVLRTKEERKRIPKGLTIEEACDIFINNNQHLKEE